MGVHRHYFIAGSQERNPWQGLYDQLFFPEGSQEANDGRLADTRPADNSIP
jgi:hypothetical protein